MEKQYYRAEEGDMYLSLTRHNGVVTEQDIIRNLERMIITSILEDERDKMPPTPQSVHDQAVKFFKEEQERLNQMVALGTELIPISLDEAKEIQEMGFAKWKQWEFETMEWD